MSWIALTLLTAFFYGVYNFFIKVSSGSIHQIVGAVILQLVATLVGGAILLFLKLNSYPLAVTTKGVVYAVLAGLFVGLAEVTSFYVFSKGVSASSGIPIMIGGSVVIRRSFGDGLFERAATAFALCCYYNGYGRCSITS